MTVSTSLALTSLDAYATIAAVSAVDMSSAVDGVRVYCEENKFVYQYYTYLEDATDGSTVIAATGKGKWKQIDNQILMLNTDNAVENAIDNVQVESIVLDAGTAAAPSFKFTGTTDGLFSVSAGSLGITTAGVLRVSISSTFLTSTARIKAPDGTNGAPGITFTTDSTSGIYQELTGRVAFSGGGSRVCSMYFASTVPLIDLAATGQYRIAGNAVLKTGVAGYVIPAGTAGALRDASSLNVDSAAADAATMQLVCRVLKALITDGLYHGFLTA